MHELTSGLSWGIIGEVDDVENYLLHGKYPEGYTKGEQAHLRRKCRDNFKIGAGILRT